MADAFGLSITGWKSRRRRLQTPPGIRVGGRLYYEGGTVSAWLASQGEAAAPSLPGPRSRTRGRALTPDDVVQIKRGLAAGASNRALAQEFGVTPGMVSHIKRARSWREVGS